MNEDTLNTSIRSFLKKVGITSQREIEQAVRTAAADGRLKPGAKLSARVVLTVDGVNLSLEIKGEIDPGQKSALA